MAQVTLVQVQTLATGAQGTQAALTAVQAAVATHNKTAGKANQHIVVPVSALPNNTKGMAWRLALLATLARKHGACMVRLGVHGGAVALCGTQAQVAATQAAMQPAINHLGTLVANAYNPATHGTNRVGFSNAYMCGAVAGLQVAYGVSTTLAYGLGYLYPFAAPGNGTAYALGHTATVAAAAPKAPKARTPKAATPTPATTPVVAAKPLATGTPTGTPTQAPTPVSVALVPNAATPKVA